MDARLAALPASYTDLVIEKSNRLLRANMLEVQQQLNRRRRTWMASWTYQVAATV
jgi:hypothetical protein